MSLLVAATNSSAEEKEPPWLLVDTEKLTLKVMRGKRAEVVFNNISVGQNGVGKAKQRGDKTTPLGRFNIGWINPESRYHLFFGLTYPSLERAELGFENGTIDLDVYIAIRMALKKGETPPQNSALGGQIGIHGLGSASVSVHQQINWTAGCIALTNSQVDRLSRWVFKGMVVVVM